MRTPTLAELNAAVVKEYPEKLRALWMNRKTWDTLTANITMYPRTDGKTDCSFGSVPVFFNELLADGMVVKIYPPFDAWMADETTSHNKG